MPELVFTGLALQRLDEIQSYIAQNNPAAADRTVDRILQSASLLGQFPMIGREGAIEGTRELTVPNIPYRIIYRIEAEAVVVTQVVHTRQQWPPARA